MAIDGSLTKKDFLTTAAAVVAVVVVSAELEVSVSLLYMFLRLLVFFVGAADAAVDAAAIVVVSAAVDILGFGGMCKGNGSSSSTKS